MSRIFRAYHPYDPYDPYPYEGLNQTSRKHGKDGKDHVIQTFWHESKSNILDYLLPSGSLEEKCISL
jgi:hypothetical protein